jgi:hypothetical protein
MSAASPKIDRARLLQLARDLPAVWNASSTETRTKQRLVHIVVQEIVCELDDATNEAVLLIHWRGGRHTEVRVARVKTGRYPSDMAPTAVDALRKLAGHWPDRELAVSLNRMRCKTGNGETWTTVRVREMRERLGLPEYDPTQARVRDDQSCEGRRAARHLCGICKEPRNQRRIAGDTGDARRAMARSSRRAKLRSSADRRAARDRQTAKVLRRISIR